MSQSPIDIPVDVQQGSASAVFPLTFNNYQNVRLIQKTKNYFQVTYISSQVRIDVFGIQEEHYPTRNGNNIKANGNRAESTVDPPRLKNPGYTLVSWHENDLLLSIIFHCLAI